MEIKTEKDAPKRADTGGNESKKPEKPSEAQIKDAANSKADVQKDLARASTIDSLANRQIDKK